MPALGHRDDNIAFTEEGKTMKITPKENYLRLGRGEDPAYIPALR